MNEAYPKTSSFTRRDASHVVSAGRMRRWDDLGRQADRRAANGVSIQQADTWHRLVEPHGHEQAHPISVHPCRVLLPISPFFAEEHASAIPPSRHLFFLFVRRTVGGAKALSKAPSALRDEASSFRSTLWRLIRSDGDTYPSFHRLGKSRTDGARQNSFHFRPSARCRPAHQAHVLRCRKH
jgi:hypothetical protein